jgi:hypothetical protein
MKPKFASLFMSAGMLLALGAGRAQAQIVDRIEVDVPFAFHAGRATLPAGNYVIEEASGVNPRVLEIASPDGRTSAFITVESAEAKATPEHTELIFNKYGNEYFLSKVFEEGNDLGSEVPPTHYETALGKGMTRSEHHVSARHPAQAMAK